MTAQASSESLRRIRSILHKENLDGFVLPRGDEFLGEYVAPYAERLAWLTGFTGSAGLAILLQDAGAVFSDGRYTEQLRTQLDPEVWSAHNISTQGPANWLASLKRTVTLGYDPTLTSGALRTALSAVPHVTLVQTTGNPIDAVWEAQPARPDGEVLLLSAQYHGCDSQVKRQIVARHLEESGADALLITDPTAVAWLLNIRGQDVPYTPVVLAFALMMRDGTTTAFIDPARVPDGAAAHVGAGVTFLKADRLAGAIRLLTGKTVMLDPASAAVWFETALHSAGATVMHAADPCQGLKAAKNDVELNGARRIQRIDSVVLCRFLQYVESRGVSQRESDLASRLDRLRAESPEYRQESFPAISAAGPNAALPHYRALPGQDRELAANEVYLIDSGGQYFAGTTDVTRTIWLGPDAPPDDLKEAFTRVLKGHIMLARAVFPVGTPGYRLDPLARYALWQAGLDYDHGTGHGVGSFLSVHEGPQNIGAAPRPVALQPGMIVSNEPGCYEPGHFGIRCENLVAVVQAPPRSERAFLQFETLNFAPFDRKLISTPLLTDEELAWLNDYHAQTRDIVAPALEGDARSWLVQACAPL